MISLTLGHRLERPSGCIDCEQKTVIDMSVEQLAEWVGVSHQKVRYSVDWGDVVGRVGSALPSDYCEIVDNFGGGSFDRHVWLHVPRGDGEVYDLVAGVREREEALRILWDAGEDMPHWFNLDSDRLISWASTGDGEYIYWWAGQGEKSPDAWPIAIQSIDGDWEVFDVSCSEFLLNWVQGQLSTELISTTFASFGNCFIRYDGSVLPN